jgi:biopolymer transport protein ExbD
MRRRLRRSRRPESTDINITAFMNLMVILVPFLLITAVFSRITILELDLPAAGDPALAATERFELEVIVRADRIEVGDRNGGLFQQIPATESGNDYEQLSLLLQQIKARYPDKLDATLLLEADIPYDKVVQAMDSIRVAQVLQEGELRSAELFPEISIGDAPVTRMKVASKGKHK